MGKIAKFRGCWAGIHKVLGSTFSIMQKKLKDNTNKIIHAENSNYILSYRIIHIKNKMTECLIKNGDGAGHDNISEKKSDHNRLL